MEPTRKLSDKVISISLGILAILVLYATSLHSYLLFHSIIEISSIIIACSVFLLVWNARTYLEDHYLFLLGVAYLFVAGLDLMHTVSYKGMGFFPEDANLSTQLWILARYTQSISLLAACHFINRKINVGATFILYTIVISFFLGTIFYWHIFPDCYIEEVGLTQFKIISEYLISLLLIITMVWLIRIRRFFNDTVHKLLIYSTICTIGSEMAFSQYVSVFGISNMIGHYLKLASFYLIYKAIIEIGLVKPYTLLFRNLKQREEMLQEHAEKLEKEIQERIKVRNQLEKSHLEIKQIFNGAADGIRVVGNDFSILRMNNSFLDYIGIEADEAYQLKCHELFQGEDCNTDNCTLKLINSGAERIERELVKRTPDGRIFTVNKTARPYLGINGELLGIIESFKDISRRKEMERIIQDERNLFIDGFVVVCKWINQPGWPIEYISPNVRRVLGYSVKQMTSNSFHYTNIIEKKDLIWLINKKKAAITSGVDNEQYDPYQIRDADNNIRWIMDHTRFVRNEQGEVDYFYGYLLDVSEYKAVEERLEKQEKLAHAGRLTSLGEMASGMAHELNQPLTVIRLAADGLKAGFSLDNRLAGEMEAV
ncbi:PAS domain S-box protein, partial [bacterium]|nr:PAS domain S-box protein [bacterium]